MKVGDLVKETSYHERIGVILEEIDCASSRAQLNALGAKWLRVLWSESPHESPYAWSTQLEVISESR